MTDHLRVGTGWRRDRASTLYHPHHHVMATATKLSRPDHSPFRSGLVFQGEWGMCVGSTEKRSVQLIHAIGGYASETLISDAFVYGIGRAQEFKDIYPDADLAPDLEDGGMEPGLALLAEHNVGIVLEEDYPGPASPNFDPVRIYKRPPEDVCVKAYDAKGLAYFDVLPSPGQRLRDAVRDVMRRGYPVQFAMFVDSAYMRNTGQVVQVIDRADNYGGGHMQLVLDASSDDFIVVDNWWSNPAAGYNWGAANGTGRMTWELFESQTEQVLAVQSAPLVRAS